MDNVEYFNRLLYNSVFAWWQWDIAVNRVIFNNLKVSMLGYDPLDFIDKGYQAFTDLLHPDDYSKAMSAMMRVLKNETGLYQVDYRIRDINSEYHWYMDRGTVIKYNADGTPAVLRGIVIDLGKEADCGTSVDSIIELIEKSASGSNDYMFTICSNCGNAKIDSNRWIQITDSMKTNLPSRISHGICPDCLYSLYPELAEKILLKLRG
ncbi:MAG TPA: PAS domain-containing protein [Spirochaetota bacterium]|nr:PAS domain-containing protein [Spirochaetota bacterium]HPF07318.1 PAS domain-containing protein [Spirochaetota bacterium]HPJ43687.1 PAS domain-containing protein [Spirochaetota bacterium]HPR37827.1 PAS domain-containing protein [Spirochaetota bacterium]